MKNYDVARILDRIADMLELKGENPYKVRAYRQVAAVVDGLTEDVEQIAVRGELLELPGVGLGISSKIQDIVRTGTTRIYDELKSEIPDGLVEMLDLPGIGTDKIRRIYHELGVASMDELEAAAQEGRLHTVPGIAEKTEKRILEAVTKYRRRGKRIPLFRAMPFWHSLTDALASRSFVQKIAVAGSLRRMKDTVGDLNIVVITEDPVAFMDALESLPQVARTLEPVDNRVRIMTNINLEAEFRFATWENWGAVFQQATGSREHNEGLRALAENRNLRLDQSGIYALGSDTLIHAGRDEESLYEELGLPWLPPEIREGRGEIEAALKGTLPRFISLSDIRGDLHTHTDASDGRNTIEEMAEAAKSRGYEYIAITDHSKKLTIARGLDEERLLAQVAMIREVNKHLKGIRVLTGAEVDIRLDGSLDHPDELLEQLDVVIASIHSGFNQSKEELTARLISAIRSPHVDIIAHPTGRIIGVRDPYPLDLDAVFAAAAEHRTALEMSAFPDRLDLSDENARMAKAAGVKLAINTDSHSTEHMDVMRMGVSTALRAWLEPADILNTLSLEELLEYLDRG